MTKKKLVEVLELAKKRKDMFFQPVAVDTAQSFLTGFIVGAGAKTDFLDLAEKRGWKRVSVGPVPEMKKNGMTDAEIIDELFEIYLQALT